MLHCPAMLVAAPASGQGKTTVTAAIARHHRHRGRRVRVFKTGPDFIDPMILERASGNPVYQLDLWMGGEDHCRQLLHDAAGAADLILIEGAMGLFDGSPSSAELASRFELPVLAVIDGAAMAQTFGAVAQGLAHYRAGVKLCGVVANHVAGAPHAAMLAESLPADLPLWAALPRDREVELPERPLGLMQAQEVADLDARLERAAALWVEQAGDRLPPAVAWRPAAAPRPVDSLAGVHIAVARDAAFSFLYRANLDGLRAMDARLEFFSPLAGDPPPDCDALYLPGGYPELHLDRLASHPHVHEAVRAHHAAGKPIVAECGGMMFLLESLTDTQGRRAPMVGLLPGHAIIQERLAALALQDIALPEGVLRGHTFHYSRTETATTPIARGRCPNGGATAEGVYRIGRLTASYIHFYFPSNPGAVAALFRP